MSATIVTRIVALTSPTESDSTNLLPESLQAVSTGDQFVAEIWIQSNNENAGIAGGTISLKYPTALLDATNFEQTSIFNIFRSGEINDEAGIVSNIGGSTFTQELGITPEFIKFATVNFTALDSGQISLELEAGDNLFALHGAGNVSADETEFNTLILNQVSGNTDPTGSVAITGDATQGETLAAHTSNVADADGLGTFSYQWKADGDDIVGATQDTFALTQDQVGKTITVTASYTDGQGTAESLTSAATTAVANVNDVPTGNVVITGTAAQGETLTADTSAIADADGLGTFSYQWMADGDDIVGATQDTFALTQDQVGKAISVTVSYTDGQGTAESLSSSPTTSITGAQDLTDKTIITKLVVLSTASEINTSSLLPESLQTVSAGDQFVAEIWIQSNNENAGISGGTISLKYPTALLDATNFEQTSIFNFFRSGEINDEAGIVSDIGGSTFDPGHGITPAFIKFATVNFTALDSGQISLELEAGDKLFALQGAGNVPADETEFNTLILNQVAGNTDPTGSVAITGDATQGETLTADTSAITDADADADGLGTFSYQWQADGVDINGANQRTFALTQDQVGTAISVTASYTDDQGTAKTLTSAATSAVENVNDPVTGSVVITGTPTQGETLSADTSAIADVDGLGTFSYQWTADDIDINGANQSTFALTQNQVGKAISVTASYTDDQGTPESLTSSATSVVANTNDSPTGNVTIIGDPVQGQTLTAGTSAIADPDGLGDFSYQWTADDIDINGANQSTFALTQNQVGQEISVTVSYTDGQGTPESLTSAATSSVANTNDSPTGNVTIIGDPVQGQTLTAGTSAIADPDGLGDFSYQWTADGVDINGANQSTFALTQDQVGQEISVTVSYTDGQGTPESLTSAATSAVDNTNDSPTGNVTIIGDPVQGQTLTADTSAIADPDGLGDFSYQWTSDGVDINGANQSTFALTQDQVGQEISVTVSYTDGQGTPESLTSSATSVVANTNDSPTGNVTIIGDPVQGQTLTAGTSAIADPDGLGDFSYQWTADGVDINGANQSTFALTQNQVGQEISVTVSYTDGQGTPESLTSAATSSVANTNDSPTGNVTIIGDPVQGQTLTAGTSAIADPDGLGDFSYQWTADDIDINGANQSTFALTQNQVGQEISVTVSYTDGQGTPESLTSAATSSVANTNDSPTGNVTIIGDPVQGQTLTAGTSAIADPDGLGDFSYQWTADGVDINGANQSTFALTQDQVGQEISVTVSYTDGQGTPESLTSAATSSVANTNDSPTGNVTIIGDPVQGQTLTAGTSAIADPDGLGTFSYQWMADGDDIVGATQDTFALTQDQVGQEISVTVSYTDGQGTAESLTSAATTAVANVNDSPTGNVVITGDAAQGETLTADTSAIADADGLGDFSYQWQADGVDINGANQSTFALTQNQVGKAISVTASYTDDQGTPESLTSAATSSVANTNDSPTGNVTIIGDPVQGQTLTADTSAIADPDGLGDFSYQWTADDIDINGANQSTFALTQNQVGQEISVTVSYTDGQGTAESLTSAATTAVANVNDSPTGNVVITGDAAQGETLTADTSAIADADGLGDFSYQWQADGVDINGANQSTFALTQNQVGKAISVTASYTDDQGTPESLTSAATSSVANTNDSPTGNVTIIGDPVQGQTLTADTSAIADPDGLGDFSYQWTADDIDINGANQSTFALTQNQVGQEISVTASYTDGQGTAESLTSAATTAVANVNDSPTGNVVITGDAAQGETLTADTSAIADADGLGTFSYQWMADGDDIVGATQDTFALTQDQVGQEISVTVSYTDGQGTAESLTSAATSAVTNTTDLLPVILISDSQGDSGDQQIQFGTQLSQRFSDLVRPNNPDTSQYITIKNSGNSMLIISDIKANVSNVQAKHDFLGDGVINILPEATRKIEIHYSPLSSGENFDEVSGLTISSNAENSPLSSIHLKGKSTFNADISHDGAVSLDDLEQLKEYWGTSEKTADVNADGVISYGDLGGLNVEWDSTLT